MLTGTGLVMFATALDVPPKSPANCTSPGALVSASGTLAERFVGFSARRRRELDSDHGGTPDEQRELSHALHGLTVLKKERIEDCSGGEVNITIGTAGNSRFK